MINSNIAPDNKLYNNKDKCISLTTGKNLTNKQVATLWHEQNAMEIKATEIKYSSKMAPGQYPQLAAQMSHYVTERTGSCTEQFAIHRDATVLLD